MLFLLSTATSELHFPSYEFPLSASRVAVPIQANQNYLPLPLSPLPGVEAIKLGRSSLY